MPNDNQEDFHIAARAVTAGDVDILQRLLQSTPGLATRRSPHDHQATLLHYLMGNGLEEGHQSTPVNAVPVAELLLEHGAEVDAPSNLYPTDGHNTPLEMLVTSEFPDRAGVQISLLETLLSHGAKPNGPSDDGMPLGMAIASGYTHAADYLVYAGARVDNLIFASALGHLDTVRQYFDDESRASSRGEYPASAMDREGCFSWPPPPGKKAEELAFVFACMHGQDEVVRYLLEQGISVDAAPIANQTGLHYAAATGQDEILRYLIKQAANPDIRDAQFQKTPLEWAEQFDQTYSVKFLTHIL